MISFIVGPSFPAVLPNGVGTLVADLTVPALILLGATFGAAALLVVRAVMHVREVARRVAAARPGPKVVVSGR
jgi:hypothetical protein